MTTYNPQDPSTWPGCKPYFIAHDVGHTRDRSTAVVGGNCPYGQRLLGILEAEELPQKLYGSARAHALAAVDHRYQSNALIIADLSYDPTYAESLFETFGTRVVGLHISSHGDGMTCERWPVKSGGSILVYSIGRNYLIELLHSEMLSDLVKFVDGPVIRRGFEQLTNLETELRPSGKVYKCSSGHDDLGISMAMLAWAAWHPHLEFWLRGFEPRARRPRPPKFGWAAFT